MIRESFISNLKSIDDSIVTYEAGSVTDAEKYRGKSIDVILLDYYLPGVSGVEAIKRLKISFGGAKIMILSGLDDESLITQCFIQGARGYVNKRSKFAVVFSALQIVVNGEIYLPSEFQRIGTIGETIKTYDYHPMLNRLSKGQKKVFILGMYYGMQNQAIADSLGIALNTVKNQLSEAYRRLGVSSRKQALLLMEKIKGSYQI